MDGRLVPVLLAAFLAGCGSTGPVLPMLVEQGLPSSVELRGVPFFPQDEFQCGPAALATVLVASGVGVSPADLVPEVYVPHRKGSFQVELIAATRKRARLAYVLPQTVESVLAQLAGGFPVLVLQRLGVGPWPRWHYAVVIGYDARNDTFLLRSGAQERAEVSSRLFLSTWSRAGRWAFVALEPGVLPASPDYPRFLEAAAELEAVGQLDAARRAYQAAAGRWPAEAMPQLGLANIAVAEGEFDVAEGNLRAAIRLDPSDVAAHNNLAELLLRRGCVSAAKTEIGVASELSASGPLAATVAETARQVAAASGTDHQGCPSH
jgi:hypothetical protein